MRKGRPIAANLYSKNVDETHEKRSHSRPRPALVFNRKSADQVLASQGKTFLNWFATDCWSKKNLICRAMEPSPVPGQFLHLHDSRPAIVRNSMHCEHVVSMSWSEVWSIQRTLLVQHISTLQLRISKSPKKNHEKPSCESFPHVLGGLVNGPIAPVGWPHVDLGSERRVAGAFQGNWEFNTGSVSCP